MDKEWLQQEIEKFKIVDKVDEKELFSFFYKILQEEEYMYNDNYRVALKGNKGQVKLYQTIMDKGCCGYFDSEYVCKSGKVYLVGFNYGH